MKNVCPSTCSLPSITIWCARKLHIVYKRMRALCAEKQFSLSIRGWMVQMASAKQLATFNQVVLTRWPSWISTAIGSSRTKHSIWPKVYPTGRVNWWTSYVLCSLHSEPQQRIPPPHVHCATIVSLIDSSRFVTSVSVVIVSFDVLDRRASNRAGVE